MDDWTALTSQQIYEAFIETMFNHLFQECLFVRLRGQDRPETLEGEAVLDLLYGDSQLPAKNYLNSKSPVYLPVAASPHLSVLLGALS